MGALVLDGIQVKRPRCREAAQQGMLTLPNWRTTGGERRTVPRGAPYCG